VPGWRDVILEACRLSGEWANARRKRWPIKPRAVRRTRYLYVRNSTQRGAREALRRAKVPPMWRPAVYSLLFTAVRDVLRYGPREELLAYWERVLNEVYPL